MRDEIENQTAGKKQSDDDPVPHHRLVTQNRFRYALHLLDALFRLRWNSIQDVQVHGIKKAEHGGINYREARLPPNVREVRQRRAEREYLDGMFIVELDVTERSLVTCSVKVRGGGENQRPSQSNEQSQRSG